MRSLVFLAVLLPSAVGAAEFLQGPQNATALLSSTAKFNCTVSKDWVALIWELKDVPVLMIMPQVGAVGVSDRYDMQNYTTLDTFTSELIIHNVSRQDSGPLTCGLLNAGNKDATLSVEVPGGLEILNNSLEVQWNQSATVLCRARGWYPSPGMAWMLDGSPADPGSYSTESSIDDTGLYVSTSTLLVTPTHNLTVECQASIPALAAPLRANASLVVTEVLVPAPGQPRIDRTVLIAVTVSVSAAILLVLLIILIVFCCKRKRRPKPSYESYEEETRKDSQQRAQNGQAPQTLPIQGKNNLGFSKDTPAGHYYNIYALSNSNRNQKNSMEGLEIPDVIQGNFNSNFSQTNYTGSVYPAGAKKVRHVTSV
nr:PREDICTED: immunoglobulin superfamily member 5 isoform X1 [Lepisosteus oculatus]XP_015196885.1 PREDICTED: immunoglobulin superfamily member 5 isoform X1 [Lepisosteus oculatus]